MPGNPSNRHSGTSAPETSDFGTDFLVAPESRSGVVASMPVESVRGRVMSSLSAVPVRFVKTPSTQGRAESAFERASSKRDVREALDEILRAYPEAADESEAYSAFLDEYRTVFVVSSRDSTPSVWEKIKNHPPFEAAVIDYLKKMVPAIFKNKYSQSLYEDIEYGLYLLGSPQNFDILEDIRHGGMRGLSGLFAKCHSAVSR